MKEKRCKLHVGDYFYYQDPIAVYQIKSIDYAAGKIWTTSGSFLYLKNATSDKVVDVTLKTIVESINEELSN